jgi:predicted deacylase
MNLSFKRKVIVGLILLVLLGLGVFTYYFPFSKESPIITIEPEVAYPLKTIIGQSVQGRNIEAYSYGKGEDLVTFVGGIHGGYEWNSIMLAYQMIDYLTENQNIIPKNITVTIIPNANPDGLYKVTGKDGRFLLSDIKKDLPTGAGRFNANNVDLNRNFACNWQATSTWRSNIVSAGSSVFSEPEAKAIQNFVLTNKPKAMIFWHSQSNTIYASACNNGILPITRDIMNIYSKASGYPTSDTFDSYVITGAVEDWLASINIPAITVELKTHETVEWEQNLAGFKAILEYFR